MYTNIMNLFKLFHKIYWIGDVSIIILKSRSRATEGKNLIILSDQIFFNTTAIGHAINAILILLINYSWTIYILSFIIVFSDYLWFWILNLLNLSSVHEFLSTLRHSTICILLLFNVYINQIWSICTRIELRKNSLYLVIVFAT